MKTILKDRILVLINTTVLCLLIVLYLGKKLVPNVFGQIYVQLPSIVLLSIFIAFGLVRSAKNYFSRQSIKKTNSSYFFCFMILTIFLLAIWFSGLVGAVVTYRVLHETIQKEIEIVLVNIENVRLHPDAETRFNNAYILYTLTGASVFYVDQNKMPVVFQPDEKAKLQSSKFKKQFKEKQCLLNQSYSLIKNFVFCLIGFIGGLLTTLTICFLFLFRKGLYETSKK